MTFEPKLNLAPPKEEGLPDFSFEGVLITEVHNGDVLWQVFSDEASIFDEENYIQLDHSHGSVFENEREIVAFKAPLGLFYLSDNQLSLTDAESVLYFETNTMNIEAKELNWDLTQQEMIGEGLVFVQSDLITLSGETLYLDYHHNKVRLVNDVAATVNIKEEL